MFLSFYRHKSAEILLVAAMANVTKMTTTTTANVILDLQDKTALKVSTQVIHSHKLSYDFLIITR